MTELTTKKERADKVLHLLERYKGQMAQVAAHHLRPDRMIRLALTACARNQQLMDCTPQSLVGSLLDAAQMGLEVDGVHAALVPYRNKGTMEAQFQPMYRGLLALAWRSNQIASVQVDVVRANDHFEYRRGLDERLDHRPHEGEGEPGELTHAYAVIKTTGGGCVWEVMTRAQIMAVRRSSRAASRGSSPWQTHEDAMWRKTVLRRALKLAPVSIEVQRMLSADEARDEAGKVHTYDMVDIEHTEPQEVEERK